MKINLSTLSSLRWFSPRLYFRRMRWKLLNSCKFLLLLNLCVLILTSIHFLSDFQSEAEVESLKSREISKTSFLEPVIYAITPTYARWTQKADLTRLSHTLMHLKNFHWIVVEDADKNSQLVSKLLKKSSINHTLLYSRTNINFKLKDTDPNWLLPRGVSQRNKGLEWIRNNVDPSTDGILYFMDDDNTYSLELFDEIRSTKVVSAWPVGLSGGLKFEGPSECTEDKVLHWHTAWKAERPFPIDMAGFSVHINLLFKFLDAIYSNRVPRGYLESDFLTKLNLNRDMVEPKGNCCKEILVWHTRTEKPKMKQEERLLKLGQPSNPKLEV